MNSLKTIIFTSLIFAFLLFSFSPTIFELLNSQKLKDPRREFILEHNYYWPDFNLYLSKIRQGWEGQITAVEKYTSEEHQGSLIQAFYLILGHLGRFLSLDPNFSYQLGRLVLSPLLLLVILMLVKYYFPPNQHKPVCHAELVSASHLEPKKILKQVQDDKVWVWQILAFLIILTSASFPRVYSDSQGILHLGRFMEWWSNIDALQRITFIPHILFGQVVSFYLLYQFSIFNFQFSKKKLILFILLGNAVGLTFPPSLITLNTVILMTLILKRGGTKEGFPNVASQGSSNKTLPLILGGLKRSLGHLSDRTPKFLFLISTLPSLLYIFLLTQQLPWSALVDFHRTHPMMIPFGEYILGTGPIFFLGLTGAVISILKRDKRFQPLIYWLLVTFFFAILFTHLKEQSPLRFTQTGLFIPLGILGSYLFFQLYHLSDLSYLGNLSKKTIRTVVFFSIIFYIFSNLLMMKVSLDWQINWISQRLGANIPAVPYPPQTVYPLKAWMDGIRWLRDNTDHNEVVLAEITAGNFIPAYSGNTVYFGQVNTVDYERKQMEVDKFFSGKMSQSEAKLFLKNGRIKYIFESVQEKEKSGGKNLNSIYPFLESPYSNNLTTIYSYNSN